MLKQNERGAISGLAVSFTLTALLLIAAIVFGAWSYSSRQDYKDHADTKINAAVKVAQQQESSLKDTQFAQEEKNPLRTYTGPEAYGSVQLSYPKTWSAYLEDNTAGSNGDNNGVLINAYFYPNIVPSISNSASVFALRMQILSQTYAQTISGLQEKGGGAKAPVIAPYTLPKLPSVVGVSVNGQLPTTGATGSMVILPLRSNTLEVWTEGNQFMSDFNSSILPNLSFSP